MAVTETGTETRKKENQRTNPEKRCASEGDEKKPPSMRRGNAQPDSEACQAKCAFLA